MFETPTDSLLKVIQTGQSQIRRHRTSEWFKLQISHETKKFTKQDSPVCVSSSLPCL